MKEHERCRACQSNDLETVLSLGEQSMSAFLLPGETARYGPLELNLCRACSLVQMRHAYPEDWFFTWYGYRSGTNPMMVESIAELADAVTDTVPLVSGDTVLDIGSNDGTLLRQFKVPGLKRIGFDPVKNLGPVAREGLDLFVNNYFTAEPIRAWVHEHGHVRAVTALAMFYELESPLRFLRDVREILDPDGGMLVIQMNYLPAMLERNGYDNIVHEHQTYYSLRSLIPALADGGFLAVDVSENNVNGGSFRIWCVSRSSQRGIGGGTGRMAAMLQREDAMRLSDPETYHAFGRRLRQLRAELREVIELAVAEKKKIYVYGASTRGLSIMEYTGLDSRLIAGAAERNPDKWGRAYGGTGILCVPEEEARAKADYFLVLPHHFLHEFVRREAEWLANGGEFIVPLPSVRLVGAGGSEWKPAAPKTALAYGDA